MKAFLIVYMVMTSMFLFTQNKEIVIRTTADGLTRVSVESFRKITFDSTIMQIHLQSGEVTGIPLGDIRFFSFESVTGIIPSVANANWTVVPTHVRDVLSFDKLGEGSHQVTIYSLTGQHVYRQTIENAQESINLSHLSTGIYIVRIGNRAIKFVKE